MDKERYDKAYRTILSKLRRETYAEDKDPKYSLDNEHGQKVLDYVKKRLEKVGHNPSSGKKEEKMLFRTESLELSISEDCLEDILNLVEEYINEVSVGMWKRAAISSLPKRAYNAGYAKAELDKKQAEKWKENPNIDDDDDFDEEGDKVSGHEFRMDHAAEVAKLPNSKMSANKVLKAAHKVHDDRVAKKREYENKAIKKGNWWDATHGPKVKRAEHSNNLVNTGEYTNFFLK